MDLSDRQKFWVETPAVAQFVANRILEVIEFESYALKPWSRRRIAEYISGSDKIEGYLSPTTLGRFLSAEHDQALEPDNLLALIRFLLHFGYVQPRELDWTKAEISVRSGLALERFFDVPDTDAQRGFYRELAGEYHVQVERGPFIATARLHLAFNRAHGTLSATETLALYRPDEKLALFNDPKRAKQVILESREMEFTATGTVLAKAGLISLFLKASDSKGFDGIVAISELEYDSNEEIHQLQGHRNAGWGSRFPGELKLAKPLTHATTSVSALRQLLSDPQYHAHDLTEKLAFPRPPRPKSSQDNRFFFDGGAAIGTDRDTVRRQEWEQGKTPDDKLFIANRLQDIALFKEALSLGADPNARFEDGTPILLDCAKGGWPDFIEVLLATGRCVIELDGRGLPPSYHAGVMVRRLAGSTIFEDVIERYKLAFEVLHAEEMRQGLSMQLKPPPEPVP